MKLNRLIVSCESNGDAGTVGISQSTAMEEDANK